MQKIGDGRLKLYLHRIYMPKYTIGITYIVYLRAYCMYKHKLPCVHLKSIPFACKQNKFCFLYWKSNLQFSSVVQSCPALCDPKSNLQFSSVAQLCPALCNPMNHSTPGLPVHHQLPEFTQTHVHRVSEAIQPSHPLSSPSPPAPNPSQHQSLFQWVTSSHEVAKVLELQL